MVNSRRLNSTTFASFFQECPISTLPSVANPRHESYGEHSQDGSTLDGGEACSNLKEVGVRVSKVVLRVGRERTCVSHSITLFRLHSRTREFVCQHTLPGERDQVLEQISLRELREINQLLSDKKARELR